MKKSIYFLILFSVISSCGTTVPVRDTISPTFIFHISGDGFSTEIDQNFNFDNKALYLKRGARYKAFFVGADAGGLKEMTFTFPGEQVVSIRLSGSNWAIGNSGDPYKLQYNVLPLFSENGSGNALNMREIIANGGPLDGVVLNYEFVFNITDMHDNNTKRTLVLRVTNDPTAIRSRD